jgi:hypothetical protein
MMHRRSFYIRSDSFLFLYFPRNFNPSTPAGPRLYKKSSEIRRFFVHHIISTTPITNMHSAETTSSSRPGHRSLAEHPNRLPTPTVTKLKTATALPSQTGDNPVSPAPKAAGMQFTANASPSTQADACAATAVSFCCFGHNVQMPMAISKHAPIKLGRVCRPSAMQEENKHKTRLINPDISAMYAFTRTPIFCPRQP